MFIFTLTSGEKVSYRSYTSIFTLISKISEDEVIFIDDRALFTKHIISIEEK